MHILITQHAIVEMRPVNVGQKWNPLKMNFRLALTSFPKVVKLLNFKRFIFISTNIS